MEKNEKNSQTQEFKGRNLEDVISHAEHILKIPRTQFNYEIVAEKTKLFGIRTKEIVIRTWPKMPSEEYPAVQFLEKLLSLSPFEIDYHITKKNDMLYFIFEGKDKSLLLHKDGALLLAIQHLLNKVSPQKVQTDCDFFKKRKERQLIEQAQQIAREVLESGKNEILDYFNPYERRIIHIAVNQIPGITTTSIGEGFLKRVKIHPEKAEVE